MLETLERTIDAAEKLHNFSSNLPEKNQPETRNEKPEDEFVKITDPEEFLEEFFKSGEYKEAYDSYFEGKKLDPDVTEEEKADSFNSSDNARIALINFSRNNRIIIKYDRRMYSEEFNKNFQDYVHSIGDVRKKTKWVDEDKIKGWDQDRRSCHSRCSDTLVRDGVVRYKNLAEGLVQLLSIEKGLETFGNAEEPTYERIRRSLV
jgi:hypothetical protein